ncbi:MAG: VanZ family protein [Acidobacteria bacterium]|nr:VanZ family protein [Acidobacteriota bacterium]
MRSPGAGHALWIWAPLVIYVVVIFYLSSLSQVPWSGLSPDYVSHAAEYFGLGLLVARALNDGLSRPVPPRRLLLAFILCVACGVADEIWQWFTPNRFADYVDVLSDACGAALGLAALHLGRGLLAGSAEA